MTHPPGGGNGGSDGGNTGPGRHVEQLLATINPFDSIRRSEGGEEYWTGRDLMPVMGYDKWERFEDAIERARTSITAAGQSPDQHASRLREPVATRGNVPDTTRVNYRFTRYGAYIVAMNGDVRKAEVAAAQTYFAIQTRKAEVSAPALPTSYADALRELAATVEQRDATAAALAIAAPAADAWNHLASAEGDFAVADAAKILSRDPQINVGRDRLFSLMALWGWVYRQTADNRWRVYQTQIQTGRLSELPSSHYHPKTGELVLDPPQVRVTAKGLQEIRTRLTKER